MALTPETATLTLHSFKHKNSPLPVTITITQVPSSLSCPILLLRHYAGLRGNTPGPFFCLQNGHPVQPTDFNATLKKAQTRAALSDRRITSHSFRIGAATYAASHGYTAQQIQTMGRWKSSAFQRYIRIPALVVPVRSETPSGVPVLVVSLVLPWCRF